MRTTLAAIRNVRPLGACGLVLLLIGAGCRVVNTAAKAPAQAVAAVTPGERRPPPPDPVEMQQALLRFADEFFSRSTVGIDALTAKSNVFNPTEALRWKVEVGTETCAIVSGPNALANLLDLTVFVTVCRTTVTEHWKPKVFGDSAQVLEENLLAAETNIWRLVGEFLHPDQRTELTQVIAEWQKQNPLVSSARGARATGFTAQQLERSRRTGDKSGNLLSLLMIDPFSGLDPAAREVAQLRLFAERAMFVSVKMTLLLRWQSELLIVDATGIPTVQQLVTNSTEVAQAAQRFATVAERLPTQLAAEREAILAALAAQEMEVANLLNSGTKMSTSLNTTLQTFDALMARFGVGETNATGAPPDPDAPQAQPFRIQDYGETAARLEAAARQLTELLATLNVTLSDSNVTRLAAQVSPVVQEATSGGKELVSYVFWRATALLGLLLAAGLIYQRARPRRESLPPAKTENPK